MYDIFTLDISPALSVVRYRCRSEYQVSLIEN